LSYPAMTACHPGNDGLPRRLADGDRGSGPNKRRRSVA
jgi:hypothetical protein